jgi:hypothetical protein
VALLNHKISLPFIFRLAFAKKKARGFLIEHRIEGPGVTSLKQQGISKPTALPNEIP